MAHLALEDREGGREGGREGEREDHVSININGVHENLFFIFSSGFSHHVGSLV